MAEQTRLEGVAFPRNYRGTSPSGGLGPLQTGPHHPRPGPGAGEGWLAAQGLCPGPRPKTQTSTLQDPTFADPEGPESPIGGVLPV